MKTDTFSILQIFKREIRFLIPLYQRPYAWSEAQRNFLWEDIERTALDVRENAVSSTPHFMGAIVLAKVLTTSLGELQAFEVIDGQQRLTTFQIFLCALRDIAEEHGSDYANRFQKYLLNEDMTKVPEIECFKLWPRKNDRPPFIELVKPNTEKKSAFSTSETNNYLIIEAYDHFYKLIKQYVYKDDKFYERFLAELFESLKDKLVVVSIELEQYDDPQTIFETLNSRGIPLTPGDLMRNFLFQRVKITGQENGSLLVDNLYEKHWQPLEGSFWQETVSRGRQTRQRLDWMLTDHLSMQIGDFVSSEHLFENYRRWINHSRPFDNVVQELESISTTAAIWRRIFSQKEEDPLGHFGRFSHAFDLSTAIPLVVYLATILETEEELSKSIKSLESYLIRRDICGLKTGNYNRFFASVINHLRQIEGSVVDELIIYLSSREQDLDRWPDNSEWKQSWLGHDQYKNARQSRLRYIFEALELAKCTSRSEDITIRSTLTIEHILPRKWRESWPIVDFRGMIFDHSDPQLMALETARDEAVNKMGNLTLLTHALNASVSNGPYETKIAAVLSQSSLALNRELREYDHWDEETIRLRGEALFHIACTIWIKPEREENKIDINSQQQVNAVLHSNEKINLPPEGTACRFTYGGVQYNAYVENKFLIISDISGKFSSFSSASAAVTQTSRNGWKDWYIDDAHEGWLLADVWRKQMNASNKNLC